MRSMLRCVPTYLVIFATFTVARSEQWPQFRGPTGQGTSQSANVPTHWGVDDNVHWKRELPGDGWSSPVVANDRIYVTTAIPDGDERVVESSRFKKTSETPYSLCVVCMDYATGDIIWNSVASSVPAETTIHPKNSHASPTAIVTADRVYAHFGPHGTAALDLEGNVIWSTKIEYNPVHGSGGSPALFEDLLIFNCDGSDSAFIVALDAVTGEERWRTPRQKLSNRSFSFSTPLVIDVNDAPMVISAASDAAYGYDPQSGDEKWIVRYPDKWSVVPRPVYANGLVLLCTGYEGPAELIAVRPDGQGDVTDTHVAWRANRFVPHNPSPVIAADMVFLVSDNGIASCRDLATGELHWKKRLGGDFSSSPLLVEDRIFYLSEDGVCSVVKAAAQFEQLAKNELNERTFASPVPLENSLLIRTESTLYRFGE